MLLSFKVKNFKSFAEEAEFSMIAVNRQTGLDYSIYQKKINGKNIKGLCSSVVYGPNAAGKSNIISAMDVLRKVILRGNLQNAKENNPNAAASLLELIPNRFLKTPIPVEFSIQFLESEFIVDYQLNLDLGLFLDDKYSRKVLFEKLTVNDHLLFQRNNNQVMLGEESSLKKLNITINKPSSHLSEIIQSSLKQDELFISNGFKLIVSPSFSDVVLNWIREKFIIIYRSDVSRTSHQFPSVESPSFFYNDEANKAAKIFGVTSNNIGYVVTKENTEPEMCSLIENDGEESNRILPAEMYESYGTIRFLNLFPLIERAIKIGATLVVDEFDASIHPMALMSILNVFHNDEINIHHAQLIFNTHNPVFLNRNVFRRDEIKFVERDDKTGSCLYSLSDFATYSKGGKTGVRKSEDYMKNYFVDRYGAIESIDFTPVFEELLHQSDQNFDNQKEE